MPKKTFIYIATIISFNSSQPAFAVEYQNTMSAMAGTIHTVKVIKGWCGNLAISTKVGHFQNGKCSYEKETVPYGYDGCTQYLNGGLLENKVGLGYQCGATRIKSNFDGSEALDEFQLILNENGHYIGTQPSYSEVELKK